MMAAVCATVLMSLGAIAVSTGAHPAVPAALFAAAILLSLVAGANAPLAAPPVPRRAGLAIAAVAFGAYVAAGAAIITGTRYHSDAVVAAHGAAELLLAGRDPYRDLDLVEQLARFGLPAEFATPLEDGTRWRALQYPALTFVVPAPFIALGLGDVRWLYLAEVLALFMVVMRSVEPARRPLAIACCVGNLAILDQYVNAGVDPLWALLVVGAWLLRRRRASGLLLGLAIATRQPAWLIAPFLMAWAWRSYGMREALLRSALAAAVALAVHLPFLLSAPAATIGGVLAPALLPLEPWGVGPAKLLADTIGPVAPRGAFVGAAAVAYLGALGLYATRRARGALVLPLAPLWLAWRALQSYFAFLPLLAILDRRD